MEATDTGSVFTLTPAALSKVKELVRHEPNPEGMALRLEVQPGGCAGFRYGLFFDEELAEDDIVTESDGVRLVCDKMSAPYLRGLKIDWEESLQRSGFTIENPNAQGRCSCGDSFH